MLRIRSLSAWLLRLASALVVMMTPVGLSCLMAAPAANRAADEGAIKQAGKDYLAALDRGNAQELAEFWTPNGTLTDETGRTVRVRELLAKNESIKPNSRPAALVSNTSIRFIAPDVAWEEGDCSWKNVERGESPAGHFLALWVRQDGRWRLESLRETRSEPVNSGSELASLDVLVGQWSGKVDQSTVRLVARWNSTKTFIRREITVITDGKESFGGIQEIGWDPLSRHIKSWMFNDDGSRGEGQWSKEGHAWMVATSQVLPEGKTVSSTQVYKFRDKDTLVWRSINGVVNHRPLPDMEVTLKRIQDSK